ncbi:MAG: TonB-dependent receptor [Pseudomonadota bacterium]
MAGYFKTVGASVLSAFCLQLAGGYSQAQEIELPGIVVIGEKTERGLQETYNSVSVFTGDEIENSTIEDIDDVINFTPNVTQRFGGEGFAIRGIRNNAVVAGVGTGPLATLYIDGTPFNSFALRTGIEELWDVEQVEIYKGPQSTSQGRNALAGTIIVKTKDPVYENSMTARAGGGTQNTRGIAGTINANIIDQVLAVRVSGDYNYTDGFNNNPTLGIDDQNFQLNRTLRGKVLFEPTKSFRSVLTVTHSVNDAGDDDVDRTLNIFDRNSFGNIQGSEKTKTLLASLDSQLDLTKHWFIKNIVTYNRARYNRLDDDNSSFTGVLNGNNALDNEFSFARDNLTTTFTEELRLHYKSKSLRGHIGAYYAKIDDDDASGGEGFVPTSITEATLNAFGAGALLPFYSNLSFLRDTGRRTKTENFAGFGEIEYDVSKFLTLYSGLRYDKEKFEVQATSSRVTNGLADPTLCFLFGGGAAAQLGCQQVNAFAAAQDAQASQPLNASTESEAWLPLMGTRLNWTHDLSTSFTVKRGYRAGGAGESLITGTDFDFDPEFVWNYEAALRSKWFDGRLTVNANVYYMDWRDQQVQLALNNNTDDVIVVNAGKSELYGFEVETYAKPTDALTLRGSLGYQRTRFVEFSDLTQNFSGNEFPSAPEYTIAAAARYQFDSGLYFVGEVNYQSEAFSSAQNRPEDIEEGRTLVNGRIGFKTGNIDTYIYSTNIFDVDYVSHQTQGVDTGKVGDGRFVGLRVRITNE